ncbi:glutaredoxin [Marinobacter santoriniensis NKSG1]|uniref:Glutaredoxin n=1 Tax=Marinobacter santoriniensis NKSG1 TaxID=1288826 RepID=M7D1V3_9GAMM|nr:glutathione S-transferase N-terminal domain-containing protein [Marinobacter santoriniensis]EMP54733.1 glutaredoxin [Marinobacter santoriniensis NKSG1]
MLHVFKRLFGDSTDTTNSEDSGSVHQQGLTLYYTPTCPFCAKVQWALVKHDLDIDKKNLLTSSGARDELVRGGGKPTVPCLRIERNGEDHWLYESDDIVAYLQKEAQANPRHQS